MGVAHKNTKISSKKAIAEEEKIYNNPDISYNAPPDVLLFGMFRLTFVLSIREIETNRSYNMAVGMEEEGVILQIT